MSEIDFKKPVQTIGGDRVRILCVDAEGTHPVVGMVNGEIKQWTLEGVGKGELGIKIENTPLKEKFYVTIAEDGSRESDLEGLTHTPDVLAQLIVSPEERHIRIQPLNGARVNVIGKNQSEVVHRENKDSGRDAAKAFAAFQVKSSPSREAFENGELDGE